MKNYSNLDNQLAKSCTHPRILDEPPITRENTPDGICICIWLKSRLPRSFILAINRSSDNTVINSTVSWDPRTRLFETWAKKKKTESRGGKKGKRKARRKDGRRIGVDGSGDENGSAAIRIDLSRDPPGTSSFVDNKNVARRWRRIRRNCHPLARTITLNFVLTKHACAPVCVPVDNWKIISPGLFSRGAIHRGAWIVATRPRD